MTTFEINDSQLESLKGRVAIVTGGSSGIGLATVDLLLNLGARVVNGDMNPTAEPSSAEFVKTDVTRWKDLLQLFKHVKDTYGQINCVFANAGIGIMADYLKDEFDADGELMEPPRKVLEVNLFGCINTVRVAIHYLRQQQEGGNIVMTASASSFQRFSGSDYTVAKHGVLGLMRALCHPLSALPIRINTVAPSWTATGLVPDAAAAKAGLKAQPPSVVARSVALLMADTSRHGQLIYSDLGIFTEMEDELLAAALNAMTKKSSDEKTREDLVKAMEDLRAKQSS